MRWPSPFARLLTAGAAMHASVPGVYAWAVTVAPLAASRGGSSGVAGVASAVALLVLVGGALVERRLGARVRFASLWGFVIACAVAWIAAPGNLGSLRPDGPRQLAGMLGWGLFAFASAAPPLRDVGGQDRVVSDGSLRAQRRLSRGDGFYVAGGAALAAAIQLVGLDVVNAERALLVRFVALAAGLAIIGASTELAFARHAGRAPRPAKARFRSTLATLLLLTILLLAGVLVADQG